MPLSGKSRARGTMAATAYKASHANRDGSDSSFVFTVKNNFILYAQAGNTGAAGAAQAAIYLDCQTDGFDPSSFATCNTNVGTTGMKAAISTARTSGVGIVELDLNSNILCTDLTTYDPLAILTPDFSEYNLYSDASIGS